MKLIRQRLCHGYESSKRPDENQREDAFDHKTNEQVPEFTNLNPTAENIAVVIWNKLRPHISRKAIEVTLYDTTRNYVNYKG